MKRNAYGIVMSVAMAAAFLPGASAFAADAVSCQNDSSKCLADVGNVCNADDKQCQTDWASSCATDQQKCLQGVNGQSSGGGGSAATKYGLKQTVDASGLPKNDDLAGQIGTIISKLLEYVAILFFGLMLYGGFLWMTSSGNGEKVSKAKGLIINAILGLVVISAAYAVTNLVISTLG